MENRKSKLPIICVGIIIVLLVAAIVVFFIAKANEKTFEDIAIEYVKEAYSGKITDCKIESINICKNEEIQESIKDKEVDKNENVYMFVKFSIKPIDINDVSLYAGNGEMDEKGWINHSWFATVENGKITGSGTGM